MKLSEIRAMPNQELNRRLTETCQEMFNLQFQFSTGQLKNTSRLSEVRRQIARMQTILRERELGPVEGGNE
jgi:large subunit ribosomal protein L29